MADWKPLMDQLMRERSPRLVGYAVVLTGSTADGEDLLHDAILKTFTRTRRFDHLNQAESYVRATMRTLLIDRHRSYQARDRAVARMHEDDHHTPELDASLDVRAALLTLSPRERVCVVMRYYDDLPIAEIARQLGIAEGTIKRYLYRARGTLSDLLDPSIVATEPQATLPVVASNERQRP